MCFDRGKLMCSFKWICAVRNIYRGLYSRRKTKRHFPPPNAFSGFFHDQNAFAAGASPWTPLKKLTALSKPLAKNPIKNPSQEPHSALRLGPQFSAPGALVVVQFQMILLKIPALDANW